MWTVAIHLAQVESFCEHGNEPAGPMKVREFLDRVSHCVGFEVLTAVVMKSSVLWAIMLCSTLKVNGLFGGAYMFATCFHAGFLLGLFLDPEDGGDMFLRNVG
jgi:hypothetical protein